MRISWIITLPGLLSIVSALAIQKRDADFYSVRTKLHKDMSGRRGDPSGKYFRKCLFLPSLGKGYFGGPSLRPSQIVRSMMVYVVKTLLTKWVVPNRWECVRIIQSTRAWKREVFKTTTELYANSMRLIASIHITMAGMWYLLRNSLWYNGRT